VRRRHRSSRLASCITRKVLVCRQFRPLPADWTYSERAYSFTGSVCLSSGSGMVTAVFRLVLITWRLALSLTAAVGLAGTFLSAWSLRNPAGRDLIVARHRRDGHQTCPVPPSPTYHDIRRGSAGCEVLQMSLRTSRRGKIAELLVALRIEFRSTTVNNGRPCPLVVGPISGPRAAAMDIAMSVGMPNAAICAARS
jgi:hypothetical protein